MNFVSFNYPNVATINVCNQMKNMNNVLRKCIDGLQYPKYLRIDKSKNNTTKERVLLPEMVVPVEDELWPGIFIDFTVLR